MAVPRKRLWLARGWIGLKIGTHYWVLRDVQRHRLLFSERNRIDCARLLKAGRWEFWLKWSGV